MFGTIRQGRQKPESIAAPMCTARVKSNAKDLVNELHTWKTPERLESFPVARPRHWCCGDGSGRRRNAKGTDQEPCASVVRYRHPIQMKGSDG